MTIETDVPVTDAEALVAKGGRILEHKRVDGAHLCTVEHGDDVGKASVLAPRAKLQGEPEEPEEPKRRGRPPKSAAKG